MSRLGLSLFLAATSLSVAQVPAPVPDQKPIAESAQISTLAPSQTQAQADAGAVTNSPPASAAATGAGGTNSPTPAKSDADKGPSSDEVQLSLQGANVDMVVQWLAQNTGKTVIKHPKVQCQLTITSSKKLSKREAITLVYRALALEGFTATESSDAILITPEGQEPKMTPELIDSSHKDIPEGRQRLIKIFPLQHMQAAELKDKIRGALSDKGTIDIDDHANRLVVSDSTENVRFIAELIKQFDVLDSDSILQVFALKHAEAEELANLIGLILNAQPGAVGGASKGGSSQGGGGPSPGEPMPGPMMGGRPFPGGGGGGAPGGGGGSPPAGGIGSQVSAPQVRLWADKDANRLIVSTAKSKLSEVQRLINLLDTEKPQDVTVRVIALKNVSAGDLVRELGPLYQKLGGRTRKEIIEVGANERSNSLIILSSEANFQTIQDLVSTLDTEEAQEKIVKTFILKNADAQDVAKQLQDLNRDQDSSSGPYRYIFFGGRGSDTAAKKMSVVADRRRNSLVIQAPPAQMENITKMIDQLDEPITDDSLAPKIFHLKYANAVDLEDVLNELFLKKTQQRSYYYFFDEDQEPQADRDVGRLYGKVRITSEPYSNTLIITSNSKESLAAVEDVIHQLDAPSEAGESTLRIQLKFAKAAFVANAINILFAKNGSPPLRPVNQQNPQANQNPQTQQQANQQSVSYLAGFDIELEAKEDGYYPWIGGQPDNTRSSDGRSAARPVSDLVGRVRTVADPRINALLISANVHFFPQILKLIEEMDAPTVQVLIEARLIEVQTDKLDALGVRFSPNGSQEFTADDYDNSLSPHLNVQGLQGFGGNSTVNNPVNGGAGVLQQLNGLRSGVLNSTLSMDFLIQFLRRTTDARVLAEPQINIRDNETGRLFVGQQVPIQSSSTFSTVGSQNTAFTYKPVGVVLEVTPHINNSGDVELRIHAESSTVVAGEVVNGGSVFDTRAFRTDLTAKNGQTLVLGGIIQKQTSDTLRKTPILGDIPGLGWAFKKRDKTSSDVELMVFMRPRVARDDAESRTVLDETYRKSPNVKKWSDETQPGLSAPPAKNTR